MERTCREVVVHSSILRIFEQTDKENEAGAVVWDAALVLLNFFCKGKLSDRAFGCIRIASS